MATEDLNLTGLKSLTQALARTRNGLAAVELATKLGLWSSEAHRDPATRPLYAKDLSQLTHTQLSDLYGLWTGEFGRITELCGAISGQEALLRIQIKSAQASARSRIRRSQPAEAKPLASQTLADMADEDQAVVDLLEQNGLLAVLSAHAGAAKEATAQYLSSLSREIAFRDAQMKARIY
jgi:hypothetical protein